MKFVSISRRQYCSRARSISTDLGSELQDFISLVQSCTDLPAGKRVHGCITAAGLDHHLFLANCLINMYVRCGSLGDANAVFSNMPERNVVSWTTIVAANAKRGHFSQAFLLFRTMLLESSARANSYTLVAMLNACSQSRELSIGRSIHAIVHELDLDDDESAKLVGNAMINMYAKCGSPDEAAAAFAAMPHKDVVSWTAMAGAYATEERLYPNCLRIFREMLLQPLAPNVVTFITAIGTCTTAKEGIFLHGLLREAGLGLDPLAGNALIHMYGKIGHWDRAYGVFKSMASRQELDLISWNAMIAASVDAGRHGDAVALFRTLRHEGTRPNSVTFVTIVNSLAASQLGLAAVRAFHISVGESGYLRDLTVGNAIISLYAKSGFSGAAWRFFRRIRWQCDVVSWNAMLGGAAEDPKNFHRVLEMFHGMFLAGIEPNKVSFLAVLNACANSEALDLGRRIHALVLSRRCDYIETSIATMLITMYGKCHRLDDAKLVFEEMPLESRSLVTWNAMIGVLAQNDRSEESFELFVEMLQGGVAPDALSFVNVLSSCSCSDQAQVLRICILESGFRSPYLDTALVSMYGKCRDLDQARRIFDGMDHGDVVSWTTMVSVTAENREFEEVHRLFRLMQLEGVMPDNFTFARILDTCLDSTTIKLGKLIHACVTEVGFEPDIAVENALLNMYSNCGDWIDASKFFEKMKARDLVSWNIMSGVYAQSGLAKESVLHFRRMQQDGLKPDRLTFAATLNASASSAVHSTGKFFHALASEIGLDSDVAVATGLVKVYSKCGKINEAKALFGAASGWNLALLNATIGALSQHGFSKDAVKLFWKMQQDGVRPDVATMVSIISACSHAGMVEEGCSGFFTMKEYFGISPTIEHYACFVDLLGRAGQLDLAERMIRQMPFDGNCLVWTSLLGTCKLQGDADRAERCARKILELDPQNSAAHVVLSNIYCAAGKWKKKSAAKANLLDDDGKKPPGMSSIEIGDKVHEFLLGDRSHPQSEEIYAVLDKIEVMIRDAGYEPGKRLELHEVDDELKMCYHSERIATAFGLIATPPETTLKIVKNLRVCGDCHTATKYISMVLGREIILRDTLRFHHFRDGLCSCRDNW